VSAIDHIHILIIGLRIRIWSIVLNKMADAQSSEASVPGEREAVPTDEPNRESIVASL